MVSPTGVERIFSMTMDLPHVLPGMQEDAMSSNAVLLLLKEGCVPFASMFFRDKVYFFQRMKRGLKWLEFW